MEERVLKFKAENLLEKVRIDSFLGEQVVPADVRDFWTRSYIKRLIGKGAIKVNEEYLEKPSLIVKEGDEIEVTIVPDDSTSDVLIPEDIDLNIEYEDDAFIYINKPSGMVVHPGAGNPNGTLANGLLNYLNNKGIELDEVEWSRKVGLAHRLDKDTSGGILIVKDQGILRRVMQKFENREIDKYYVAVVYSEGYKESVIDSVLGTDLKEITQIKDLDSYIKDIKDISEGWSEVDKNIIRHPENRRKMSISDSNGRHSITRWKILGRVSMSPTYRAKLDELGVGNLYLVLIKPVTGRIHQIRVHLKSEGLPVLGDQLYGKGYEIFNFMFLHSFSLAFELSNIEKLKNSGKTAVELQAGLPENWSKSIEKAEVI